MYWTFDATLAFATANYEKLIELASYKNTTLVLCPSSTTLYPLAEMFKETLVKLGAQDCSDHTKGAYTGQVSADSLKSLHCSFGIVGHSERRQWCGETNQRVADKCAQLISSNITPIVCVGESLQDYEAGKTLSTLEEQLAPIFTLIKEKAHTLDTTPVVIAYEPIWAIGTGVTASSDHIDTVFTWLTTATNKIAPSVHWQFLYGGSVSGTTIQNFKKIDRISGFLIGGASLDFQELEKIVHCS